MIAGFTDKFETKLPVRNPPTDEQITRELDLREAQDNSTRVARLSFIDQMMHGTVEPEVIPEGLDGFF